MAPTQPSSHTDKYFRIIFIISSLCGLFPYLLKKDNFKIALPLCFFTVPVFILLALLTAGRVWMVLFVPMFDQGVLHQAITILLFTMMPLVTMLGMATSSLRASAINKIFNSLRDFDRHSNNHWKTLSADWKEKNIIGVLCVFLFIVYYHYFAEFLWMHLTGFYYFILSLGVYLTAAQFSATALLVRKRLSSLCYFLKQVRLDGNISLAVIEIKHLVYLHNRLCDVAVLLNESFTILLTVHITSGFMVTVVAILQLTIGFLAFKTFNVSFFIPNRSVIESIQKIRIIVAIMFFSSIWQICTCSTNVSKKINKFNNLLYRLMVKDVTQKLLNEEQLRFQVATKREVVFTACGFFRLDYTLIHSMVAAVTSYIIMLKQFYVPK